MSAITRQQLREIVIQYGRVICDDPTRCRGLLQHYAPNAKRETNVLINALHAQVAADLLTAGSEPFARQALRLSHRLQAELAMTPEAARWGVLTWAYALGVASDADLAEAELGLGNTDIEAPHSESPAPPALAKPKSRRTLWQRLFAPPAQPLADSTLASPTIIPPAPPAPSPASPSQPQSPTDRLTLSISPGIKIKFSRIPAGPFIVGSHNTNPEMVSDESPQHQVTLGEYYMARYPVTNAQYATFVQAVDYRAPMGWETLTPPTGKEQHAVVGVTWADAVAFCGWAGSKLRQTPWEVRLPTEAEWEKAARGVDGRTFPWGNDWDAARANVKENTHGDTLPVGFFSPQGDSVYGIADIVGDVWEWCADWYFDDEYRLRVSANQLDNPRGPATGSRRVVRGTSFLGDADTARCSFRFHYLPTFQSPRVGFRVVLATTQVRGDVPLLESGLRGS